MTDYRKALQDKKRIVIKIGSSSLQHKSTGDLDYIKLEKLVRELCDIRNQGKDVVLVSSGAIAVGKKAVKPYKGGAGEEASPLAFKQACAAVGQARLMMTYQKLFAEYNQIVAQILMTKNTVVDDLNRYNAHNTFSELLRMGIIPIVNENDTIATYEINVAADNDTLIGDNDTLSAIVSALVEADLLILLSDIDGLYTDDPRRSSDASFIEVVEELTDEYMHMGKASTGSSVGTGGMNTKMTAAKIATSVGADMVIANSKDVGVLHRILEGENEGTLFVAHKDEAFGLADFVENLHRNEDSL
ncbi:MAG: glutamate 5-kinase [Lachnospiraceae bacterium]|nr:glutamate 5-kinase [Lachnospiraceae bacterium]